MVRVATGVLVFGAHSTCVAAIKLPSPECFHLVLIRRRAWALSCQRERSVKDRLKTTKRRKPLAKTSSWGNYCIGVPFLVRNVNPALQHY